MQTELLARGVLVHEGHILLTINKKKKHYYLPGGHIEFSESARTALIRELKEETGLEVRIDHFLGVVEHGWHGKNRVHAEINLIFTMICNTIDHTCIPASREEKIAFAWYPLKDLSSINFQPAILRALLPTWLEKDPPGNWVNSLVH